MDLVSAKTGKSYKAFLTYDFNIKEQYPNKIGLKFVNNGRTARMVSLWINILSNNDKFMPVFLSEAISLDKANYYKAIDDSRNTHNNLTFFISYLTKLSNKYYLVYKNIDLIEKRLMRSGETLTATEIYYLKRIIISSNGWFNYKAFIEFARLDISKQGALKTLNKFLEYNFLITKNNSKK